MRHFTVASTNHDFRLWREPTEAETSKSRLEKDHSAAARSSIRRQPTIRRPRQPYSRSRGAHVLSSFHSQILDEIQRGIGEPPSGVRSPVMNVGVSEDGVDLDASRREALGRTTTTTRSTPSFRHIHSRRSMRSSPREPSETDSARDPFLHVSQFSSPHPSNPSLTPNFAPATAYRSHSVASPQPPEIIRIRDRDLRDLPPLRRTDSRNHDLSSQPAVMYPRISRLRNENARRDATRTPIDGLGDRQRSLSPEADRETDVWETLLSTIAPDTNLPSTDTSFSSTSASASDALRNSIAATRPSAGASSLPPVHITPVHMSLEPYPDHLNPCDFSSDDEDNSANYHQYMGSQSIPSHRRSPGLHSTMSNHPPLPTISLSFGSLESGDTDLQQMQAILDRLARREDIPDDWWAGAGLSRNMGRGLSATAPTRPNENTD